MSQISYAAEVRRKLVHLGNLAFPIGTYFLGRERALWILVPLMIASIVLDVLRAKSEPARRLYDRFLGSILRDHERAAGGAVVLTGATWVIIGAVLTIALFPVTIAIAALAMMSLCDIAAALVGRRWGRIRFGAKRKSVEGCVASLIAGIVVAALVPGLAWPVGIAGAVGATLGELPSGPLDDNIRIPVVAGLFMVVAQKLVVG